MKTISKPTKNFLVKTRYCGLTKSRIMKITKYYAKKWNVDLEITNLDVYAETDNWFVNGNFKKGQLFLACDNYKNKL